MKNITPEEIGSKMHALGIWNLLEPFNFALKPRGTVFPYFCVTMRGDGKIVAERMMMLEGWQTMHDYVRMRADPNFGFYSSYVELPHLELVILASGGVKLCRYDTGLSPKEANASQRKLCTRLLWEAYGMMLRVEADRTLPMKYSAECAIFARVETAAGKWEDTPFEIPDPPPYTETVSYTKADLKAVQDLPFAKDWAVWVNFMVLPRIVTKEAHSRCVYELSVFDDKPFKLLCSVHMSVQPDFGLRQLWEYMPTHLLRQIAKFGKMPGEIKTWSGRVFRFLQPLCMDIPFKLSLHDGSAAAQQSKPPESPQK